MRITKNTYFSTLTHTTLLVTFCDTIAGIGSVMGPMDGRIDGMTDKRTEGRVEVRTDMKDEIVM